MKIQNIFLLACGFLVIPYGAHAVAACSKANLTRCLDSVCAINVSSNPAARCQYCGSSSAGTPPKNSGMKSVGVGQSSKYTLSEKELKKAPTSGPGELYAWATVQCVTKVQGCSPDDVTDVYDPLIEQSCKAAGIDAQLTTLRENAKNKPTKASCQSKIRSCVIAATRCNYDYRACENDTDLDKYFSECSIEATDCDQYTAAIKKDLITARDTAIENVENTINGIIKAYQTTRENRLASIRKSCQNNATMDTCVQSVCNRNMSNKCDADFPGEKTMAIQLCKFYEIACNTLK